MRRRTFRRVAIAAVLSAIALIPAGAAEDVRLVKYAEISGVLDEVPSTSIPLAVQAIPSLAPEGQWAEWIAGHDTEIRARLAQGDEDTLVNWLLFGTSFTKQPRVVLPERTIANEDPATVKKLGDLIHGRILDFLRALIVPGTDERRLFARKFFEGNGFKLTTVDGVNELGDHLLDAIDRIAMEQEVLGDELAAAGKEGTADTQVGVQAHLYSTRGLSLDTSLAPNYAVEQALVAMKGRSLIRPGSVARVAIVGAGLDFADKDAGLDLYPVQTVQPFAVIDTLKKLGLAPAAATPDIVCFDISPRVLDHVSRAKARAAKGAGYTLNLPLLKGREYVPEFRQYWQRFGQQIGTPVTAAQARNVTEQAELRTIRVGAATVQHVSTTDLNIVTERMENGRFDLIIATNVFLYYDGLDQALAFANVEAMLKNGGFLLTNTVLPEVLWVPMELVDSTTTLYDAVDHGDRVLWYQRMAGSAQ